MCRTQQYFANRDQRDAYPDSVSHLQAHHARPLNVAHERVGELDVVIEIVDVEADKHNNILIKAERPALAEDAGAYEALAAERETVNDAIESQRVRDEAEGDFWHGVFTAEHVDLFDEQRGRTRFCRIERTMSRSPANTVSATLPS